MALEFGADQVLQAGIIGDGTPCPLHHAESGEGGLGFPVFAEKCGIGGVGAGIAALDVIDAEAIQHLHHNQLVIQRKINARRLLRRHAAWCRRGRYVRGSSLDLPTRRAVLVVLDRNAHGSEFIADAIRLSPVLSAHAGLKTAD